MTDVDPKARIAGVFDRAAPTYEQTGVEFFAPPGRALVAAADIGAGERVLDDFLDGVFSPDAGRP